MKTLTLQIDRPCFKAILNSRQTIEHRYIYPSNAKRYVIENELPDGSVDITPVKYDAMKLINGRRKDAPKLVVEVLDARFVVITDEEGKDCTFVENGEEYLVCQVWYHLGKILSYEGPQEFVENADESRTITEQERAEGIFRLWEDDVND